MSWKDICDIEDFQTVLQRSEERPVLLFKHSTRCSISSVALARLDGEDELDEFLDSYLIDVINCRPLSNLIANHFEIRHESPQILLIFKGECIYDESHLAIFPKDIKDVTLEAIKGSPWRIAPH